MKHLVLFLTVGLALTAIAGCTTPVSVSKATTGGRSLTLSCGSFARTILPTNYPAPDGYTVVLHPQSGTSGDVTVTETTTTWPTITGLAAVVYTVTVTATKAGTAVATGTATADLTGLASLAVTVSLSYLHAGTGTGQIHLTFAAAYSGLASSVTVVSPSGTTTTGTLVDNGDMTYSYTNASAEVGTYQVYVTFVYEDQVRRVSEAVLVVPTADTVATIAVTDSWVTNDMAAESLALNADSLALKLLAGQDPVALGVDFTPEGATQKVVTWNSSFPSVATVSTDGRLTPLSAGTTTITATWPFDTSVYASTTITVLDIGKTIYVGGNLDNGAPGYWKNGAWVSVASANPSGANHVSGLRVSSAGDVYVGGSYWDGGFWTAVMWKNGVANTYSNGARHTLANAITLDGAGTPYLGGWAREVNSPYTNCVQYWINGVRTDGWSTTHSAAAYGIAVSNGDVYLVGSDSTDGANFEAAVFKNSTQISLGTTPPHALYAIAASGSTVYVAGTYSNQPAFCSSSNAGSTWASYTTLPRIRAGTTDVYASKVFLDGSDVYIAGCDGANAVYWKNGVEHDLGLPGQATSIVVANGHVLVTGTDKTPIFLTHVSDYPGYTKAYLWVDGQLVTLGSRPGGSEVDCFAAEVWVP